MPHQDSMRQKGFALVSVLSLIAVLVVGGVVHYRSQNNQSSQSKSQEGPKNPHFGGLCISNPQVSDRFISDFSSANMYLGGDNL